MRWSSLGVKTGPGVAASRAAIEGGIASSASRYRVCRSGGWRALFRGRFRSTRASCTKALGAAGLSGLNGIVYLMGAMHRLADQI